MSHHDDCETCGKQDATMVVCQDTIFCGACWKDFGTDRWKGIGSKLPKETDERGKAYVTR